RPRAARSRAACAQATVPAWRPRCRRRGSETVPASGRGSLEEPPVPLDRTPEPFVERVERTPAEQPPCLLGAQVLVSDLVRRAVLNPRFERRVHQRADAPSVLLHTLLTRV